MRIQFEKWHGCKNDFLIFHMDERQSEILQRLERLAKHLCSRDGSGVGGDGILVISTDPRSPDASPKLRIFNSDGSRASTCGNGIRVAALSILRKKQLLPHSPAPEDTSVEFLLVTGSTVECRFWPVDTRNILVGVDMGEVLSGNDVKWYASAEQVMTQFISSDKGQSFQLEAWQAVETQNPHLVLIGNWSSTTDLAQLGAWLQSAPGWPAGWTGINVHFVKAESEELPANKAFKKLPFKLSAESFKVFVFERGAGPTQACGSGAVAIAEFLHQHLHLSRKELLTISMPGGDLFARVDSETRRGELIGPGTFVFSGEIEI